MDSARPARVPVREALAPSPPLRVAFRIFRAETSASTSRAVRTTLPWGQRKAVPHRLDEGRHGAPHRPEPAAFAFDVASCNGRGHSLDEVRLCPRRVLLNLGRRDGCCHPEGAHTRNRKYCNRLRATEGRCPGVPACLNPAEEVIRARTGRIERSGTAWLCSSHPKEDPANLCATDGSAWALPQEIKALGEEARVLQHPLSLRACVKNAPGACFPEGGAAPNVLPRKTLAPTEGSRRHHEGAGSKLGSRPRRGRE
jgi:hypothetical protein